MAGMKPGGEFFRLRAIGWVVRDEEPPREPPRGVREVIQHSEELMSRPATLRILDEYCRGLIGVKPGSLMWVIWLADRAPSGSEAPLVVRPFMDESLPETGVFATRSPARPNPVCLSLVYVEEVEGCSLRVRGLDAYNGTPVLDLKPYTEGLDSPGEALRRAGRGRG